MVTENVETSVPENLTNPNRDVEQGHVNKPTKTKKPVDANIPINAMVMGYVAKAFGDMPEIAFNLMRPDLTKNATALTCLLLIFLILQIFVGGFVYFIDVTKEQHTLKYKVLSNWMNLLGLITAFFTATLAIMEKNGYMFK